jgi:chitodextrinase
MLSSTRRGVRRSGRRPKPGTRRALLAVASLLAVAVATLAGLPPASAAATCQDSSPAGGTYTVRVCLTAPDAGQNLTGKVPVTATASVVSGTGPGFQRMVFTLDGQYLLTDYQPPYSFTLDTRRFLDGPYTIGAHVLARDTFVSPDTTVQEAFANGVTTQPVNTRTFTPPQGTPVATGDTFTVAAAGDGAGGDASETAVTNLISSWNPNLMLYLGDVYEKGTSTEFDNWYGDNQPDSPFYGRLRSITLPSVGNHEYEGNQAPGYFDYWDNVPHYYSVNRHGWHIISLDSNSAYGQLSPTSAQYQWLQQDLAANTQPCTLAFFHHPRFNIGDEGPSTGVDGFWKLFAQYGVDLVVNGHDHTYQRYAALDGNGNPDPAGVTEIINGAGGHALGQFPGSDPNLVKSAQEFGALRLGLNQAGAAFRFTTVNGSTLDSGSVKCNSATADTTSPTAPLNLTATSTYKTRIDLSWKAATDNVGVTRYRVFRDGSLLTTVDAGESYADNAVTPGSTHSYTVRALDDAGNVSAASDPASATTPAVSVLFHDGFESGDLSQWTNPPPIANPVQTGLAIDTTQVSDGAFSARSTVNGNAGSAAWHTLAQPESNLYYTARFKAVSHTGQVNLMRLRNGTLSSGAIASLALSTTNKLTLRNDAAGSTAATTLTSTVSAATGAWHTLQLHAQVNGASSVLEVWLDGNPVPELGVTEDLGTNPVAKIELGDPGSTTSTKTFDIAYDEVAYDREFIGDLVAPTAPTGLTATAHSGLAVDLSWTPGNDNVGVTGYDVYRNGSLLTSIGAGSTYRDATVAPYTAYSYKLVAKDAAGNSSGFSNTSSVQTGDIFTDDFESGNLSQWSTVNGLVTSQQLVDGGSWAARATSDGTAGASAQDSLDAGVDDVFARVRFDLVSRGANNVNLVRLRNAANGAMVTVFVSSTGKLGYRNDLTGTSTTTTTSVPTGIWQELQVHVVDGDTGKVELWLNGLSAVSKADSLGTNPVGRVELGDTSVGRTFDVAFDNVVLSPAFVADALAPTAPSNLRVTGKTATSVDLAWDAANDDVGVVGYRVYRDGAAIADLDGSSGTYTDGTATDSTQYTYTVRALDAVGHQSAASNSVVVTTTDATKPTAPTNVTASPVAGQNKVTVAWSAATDNIGVTGYRVYRDDLAQPLGTVGATLGYTDDTVASTTAYTYRVTALDAEGNESAKSAPATVTSADTTAPSAPGGVTATAASDVAATVSWTAATDAVGVTGYDVYRNGAATPVGSVSGSTLTYKDTGLTGDATVTYTVKARDAAGNVSPASASASTTTWVFADGFETGNFSRWTTSTGIAVQTTEKFSGSYGALASLNKGTTAEFASRTLPGTYTDLYYDVRFKLLSGKSSNTNILRFRSATGGNILGLYYSGNKTLGYRNDVANTTTLSTTSIPVGVWQEAQVRVRISGATSRVDVWFNGNPVTALTKQDNLGSNPVGQVVAGESTSAGAYDFALDDVRVTRTR